MSEQKQENQKKQENQESTFYVDNSRSIQFFYSFYDRKTRVFFPPFLANSEEEALRQASNICNYTNSLITKFPSDYDLYCLGLFYDIEGTIVSFENIKLIVNCADLKREDSIIYDELLREIEQQKVQLTSIIQDYESIHKKYEHELRVLATLKDKLPDKRVQLYQPKKSKMPLIKRLFG